MRTALVATGSVLLVGLVSGVTHTLWADEIRFKNGDRLNGRIVEETDDVVVVEHEATGTVTVQKVFVEDVKRSQTQQATLATEPDQPEAPEEWTGEISAGYNVSRGNTQTEELSSSLTADRHSERDQWTLKTSTLYGATSKKMNAQRHTGAARYAWNFGERKAWYNSYKLEADHDRFANIDWRVIPSIGVGYWFVNREDFKATTEVGVGWEIVHFRDATPNRDHPVLTPRAYGEKTFGQGAKISQELLAWPSLEDRDTYRLKSETVFTNPISKKLSLRFSLVDDYQSQPGPGIKKSDLRLTSSLVYSL